MSRGRDKFRRLKPAINIIVRLFKLLPVKFRKNLLTHYRMKNGNTGLVVRYALLKTLTKRCGDNVSVHPGVYLLNIQNLSIGENVSIHPMCYIECGECGIEIGNDVSLAHAVSLIATNHRFQDINVPVKDQGIENGRIVIKDNVWIGAKATVLYNNTVESGSIIAANCVVTKDVPANSIVAGIPGRIIKTRS